MSCLLCLSEPLKRNIPPPGAAVNQEARAAGSIASHLLLSSRLVRWEKLEAQEEENKIIKREQNSNNFTFIFPLVGYEK